MKKFSFQLIVFLFALCTDTSAQDFDIPDFRSKRDGFLKVQDKVLRADLATFTIGGISESLIAQKLPEIPYYYNDEDQISFIKDTIQVHITTGAFDSVGHKLLYYEDKYLIKIDNKGFWGSGTNKPKKTIKSVQAIIGTDTIQIPTAAFVDLYEPVLSHQEGGKLKSYCRVFQSLDKQYLYIYMLNSEGKNRYEVTWVIQNRQYLRRVVDIGY